MVTTAIDPDKLGQTVLALYKIKQGELLASMVHLGNRLGLYEALAGAGPVTSAILAERTGLQERWVREWLFSQAAADLIEHDDGQFTMPPETAAALVDESNPAEMSGVFGPPVTHEEIDRTAEAFSTGMGLRWDEHGEHTCHFQAAMGAAGQQAYLVPVIIAAFDGLTEKLQGGATVVDVGCGAGVAATTVAAAFPTTTVIGIDPSQHAIEASTARATAMGLSNVDFRVGAFDDLAELAPVDLLMTLDVLHDLPHPDAAIAAAKGALAGDGVWLVADIKGRGDFEANRKIPVLSLMYSMSVLYCMSSALSEPGGEGLGTLGMHAALLEEKALSAGFSSVVVHDHKVDPTNRYFEIR